MQETRQFLHKFAVVSVYFSENINNSTIFLEAFKLVYVCPCIIHEIDERYPLDATIYLLL